MAKKAEASNTGTEVIVIHCPGCESSLTSDGRELREKSKKLKDWEEQAAAMPTVNSALEKAEGRIAALEEENKALKEKEKIRVIPKRVENPDEELES
jgi:hypothetical protein